MKLQLVISVVLFHLVILYAECKECVEVGKGKIPTEYLAKSVKELPSGIKIYDVPEAKANLNTPNMLWVDTRPQSFFNSGTLKKSVLLVYDKKGKAVAANDAKFELTEPSLLDAMAKVNSDVSQVTVVFFCQGPKCHRSYNAALRAVSDYKISSDKVVWFRAGYPAMIDHYQNNPKLKRKIPMVFKGDVISQ